MKQTKERVSIHAPAWGATASGTVTPIASASFNPRSRVGSDRPRLQFLKQFVRVSIHAPAWGATVPATKHIHIGTSVSIHAPAWGATPKKTFATSKKCSFQSTLPRGERHQATGIQHRPNPCFNPRSRVGSDFSVPAEIDVNLLFQSTLPRGERQQFNRYGTFEITMFQSTLPRGERHAKSAEGNACLSGFNPRSRVGSDPFSRP